MDTFINCDVKRKYDQPIGESIYKAVENGATFEGLVIVTSISDFKHRRGLKHEYRSEYGDTDIIYDPMLPSDTIYVINRSEVKPNEHRSGQSDRTAE